MGQCMVRIAISVAVCAACILAFLELSRPRPLADRLAVISEKETRIDNVSPFNAREKWAVDGAQAGLHRLNPSRVAYFDKRIRSLMRPPFRVLDAGCGGGLVANALAGLPGYSVQGVDMSPEALQFAEETAARVNLTSSTFSQASVYEIPFANESFDVVIMSDVLEHLLDLHAALAEVARVLRPGGVFLFDTIDRTWSSYLVAIVGAEYIVGLVQRGTHDWRLFIRPKELKKGLENSGFHSFAYESFDPTLLSLIELSLFQFGVLRPEYMRGGWNVGSASLAMMAYIGQAVKSGRPKAAARSPPAPRNPAPRAQATAASQAEARSAPAAPASQAAASSPPAARAAAAQRADDGAQAAASSPPAAPAAPAQRADDGAQADGRRPPVAAEAPQVGDRAQAVASTPPAAAAPQADDGAQAAASGPLTPAAAAAAAAPQAMGSSPLTPAAASAAAAPQADNGAQAAASSPAAAPAVAAPQADDGAQAAASSPLTAPTPAPPQAAASSPLTAPTPAPPQATTSRASEPSSQPAPGLNASNSSAGSGEAVAAKPPARPQEKAVAAKPPARPQEKVTAAEPSTHQFKVGEEIELQISSGATKGSWVRGHVRGLGAKADTYLLHVPAMPPSQRDIPWTIPAASLRRFKVEGGSYKVGEAIEIKAEAGPLAGTWVRGSVTGWGSLTETYDISIGASNASGQMTVRSVPGRKLRKAQAKERKRAPAFEAGEEAEIKGVDGKWSRCNVTGQGQQPESYDIEVRVGRPPGVHPIRNVPVSFLRKLRAGPLNSSAVVPKATEVWERSRGDFEAGQKCMLMSTSNQGSWTAGTVLGKGRLPDTYDVRIPSVKQGNHTDVRAVPVRLLISAEAAVLFKVGDMGKVKIFKGKAMGQWVQCVITGTGPTPHRYSIHVFNTKPPGYSEVANVSAYALRREAPPADGMPEWATKALEAVRAARDQAAKPAEPEQHFQAGEVALVKATGGPKVGSWTRCNVVSNGTNPGTYHISVGVVQPPGYLNLSNIPASALRKVVQENVTVFQAGSQAEIQVREGPLSGVWLRCLILGPGTVIDTYNIRMMGLLANEEMTFTNIPRQALRELPKDAPVLLPAQPPPQPTPEQLAAAAALLEPPETEVPSQTFQAGEAAEVRASEGWVRCIIGERGTSRNTYNIRVVSDNTDGYLDVPNIPAHKLRKSARPSTIAVVMWILEILFSMR